MDLLWTGPALPDPDSVKLASPTLMLAHGAGAAMDSSWMNDFCDLLAQRGLRTVRFEFGYMSSRRGGGRRPPPRAESVVAEYLDAIAAVRAKLDNANGLHGSKIVIGGKSMGGRVATLTVDSLSLLDHVDGVVCLGYPFHPTDKPLQIRTAHLLDIPLPVLICQGTRDPFGGPGEVAGYGLPPQVDVRWFDDGDHDLRPRKAISGHTYAEHLAAAADAVLSFVEWCTTAEKRWVADLLVAVPELSEAHAEHMRHNFDDQLTHVFFGDVTRWVEEESAADPHSPAVAHLVEFLERTYPTENEYVRNVIAVSFIEDLFDWPGITQLPQELDRLARRFHPHLFPGRH